MALIRPTLLAVPSFDAKQDHTFAFVVKYENAQITSNRLVIRRQSDNQVVYDERQETFKYEHVVNANELSNGEYYNAVVSVFDAEGNQSPESVPIQFWCYSTPKVEFTNIPNTGIVVNASFNFMFSYVQNESEALNMYVINLYNAYQTQIATSGVMYAQNGAPPYFGEYLFAGFEDNTTYFIELVATTINNAVVSTNRVQFTVKYSRPDLFTLLELKNNCSEGYITVRSNIIAIEGISNPALPIYIDNKEVDLTAEGSWVSWNDGYQINGDFLARAWFRRPNNYAQLLQFSNIQGETISLKYMKGYSSVESNTIQAYVELHVTAIDGIDYYIFSNYVDILTDDKYYNVWLKRVGDLYQLQLSAIQ